MDNYFTLSKTLVGCRKEDVGAFGTARARQGWPPVEVSVCDDNRFNSFYMMNDKDNYRIFHWYNNNTVKLVSNVHTGLKGEDVMASRKKLELT